MLSKESSEKLSAKLGKWISKVIKTTTLTSVLFLVASCSGGLFNRNKTKTITTNKTIKLNYECGKDNLLIVTNIAGTKDKVDSVKITNSKNDKAIYLPHVKSGSGEKYKKGETLFWRKGNEAIFSFEKHNYKCKQL